MCKRGDTFSLAVLIGRGLDFVSFRSSYFSSFVQFSGCVTKNAPFLRLIFWWVFFYCKNKQSSTWKFVQVYKMWLIMTFLLEIKFGVCYYVIVTMHWNKINMKLSETIHLPKNISGVLCLPKWFTFDFYVLMPQFIRSWSFETNIITAFQRV